MTTASFSTKPIDASDPRSESAPLIFGIFPGMAGTESIATEAAMARTYDPDRTEEALARLHQPGRPFVVRQYVIYRGDGRIEHQTPPDVTPYLGDRRILDHVTCATVPQDGDIGDWTSFLRRTVRQLGDGPAAYPGGGRAQQSRSRGWRRRQLARCAQGCRRGSPCRQGRGGPAWPADPGWVQCLPVVRPERRLLARNRRPQRALLRPVPGLCRV